MAYSTLVIVLQVWRNKETVDWKELRASSEEKKNISTHGSARSFMLKHRFMYKTQIGHACNKFKSMLSPTVVHERPLWVKQEMCFFQLASQGTRSCMRDSLVKSPRGIVGAATFVRVRMACGSRSMNWRWNRRQAFWEGRWLILCRGQCTEHVDVVRMKGAHRLVACIIRLFAGCIICSVVGTTASRVVWSMASV